jgi:hypothetical protein
MLSKVYVSYEPCTEHTTNINKAKTIPQDTFPGLVHVTSNLANSSLPNIWKGQSIKHIPLAGTK